LGGVRAAPGQAAVAGGVGDVGPPAGGARIGRGDVVDGPPVALPRRAVGEERGQGVGEGGGVGRDHDGGPEVGREVGGHVRRGDDRHAVGDGGHRGQQVGGGDHPGGRVV